MERRIDNTSGQTQNVRRRFNAQFPVTTKNAEFFQKPTLTVLITFTTSGESL